MISRPVTLFAVPYIWYCCPAEIDCIPLEFNNNLWLIWVEDIFAGFHFPAPELQFQQSRQLKQFIRRVICSGLINGSSPCILITISIFSSCFLHYSVNSFRTAVCPAQMIGRGHNCFSSKLQNSIRNPFIIRSNINMIKRFTGLFINSLYHRFVPDQDQRFSRKPGRCIPCRYNSGKMMMRCLLSYCEFTKNAFPNVLKKP